MEDHPTVHDVRYDCYVHQSDRVVHFTAAGSYDCTGYSCDSNRDRSDDRVIRSMAWIGEGLMDIDWEKVIDVLRHRIKLLKERINVADAN